MNYKQKYKDDILSKLTPKDKLESITTKLDLNEEKGEKVNMKKRIILGTTGVCAALIVGLGACFLFEKPEESSKQSPSMVQMNLNPKITFMVDEDNKVVSVSGENDEGKMIIAGEDLEGKTLNEAIEIVLTIENETGYLVSGNARIEDNNISFSVSVEDEEIKKAIQDSITTTVNDVCEELNVAINDKVSFLESYSLQQLQAYVLSIDPSLTQQEVEEMSYEELLNVVKLYQIETAELYSLELVELYNQAKEYNFTFAESDYTTALINEVKSASDIAVDITLALYNSTMNVLKDLVNQLNETRYEHFVKEDSFYHLANARLLAKKQEVIAYRNQLASVEVEDSEKRDAIISSLNEQEALLDGIILELENSKNSALEMLNAIEAQINTYMVQVEQYKDQIIASLSVDFEAIIKEKATELDAYLNTSKAEFFAEFESKYADDIEKAKQDLLAYKESLKNNKTTETV